MGWIQSALSVFEDKRELLDPSCFEDELALQVDWMPLVRGGNNFCTHRARLRQGLTGSTLTFEVTPLVTLACSGIVLSGVVMSIELLSQASPGAMATMAMSGMSGFFFWQARRHQICFDQSNQVFIRQGRPTPLLEVHALQLLREFVQGNKNSYDSYELNLVLRDGRRLNVIDHGTLHAIRKDALILADYLGVSIWDAIDLRLPEHHQPLDPKMDLLRMNLFR